MDKKSHSEIDPFDDDDLFEGLADSDYQVDDDLSEGGHAHEDEGDSEHDSNDDEQAVYHYEDEEADTQEEPAPEVSQKHSLIDRFKHTLKSGSLSDKIRAILIPLIFAVLILGFCIYKLVELISPAPSQTASTTQGLNVRQFIAKPKNPSDALNSQNSQTTSQSAASSRNTASSQNTANSQNAGQPSVAQAREISAPKQGAPLPSATGAAVNNTASQTNLTPTQPQPSHTQTTSIGRLLPATAPTANQANTVQSNEQKVLQGQTPLPQQVEKSAAITSSVDPKVQSMIAKIQAQQTQNAQKIATLQNKVNSMNTQFTHLNTRLKTLLNELQAQVVGLKHAREAAQKVAVLNKRAQKNL